MAANDFARLGVFQRVSACDDSSNRAGCSLRTALWRVCRLSDKVERWRGALLCLNVCCSIDHTVLDNVDFNIGVATDCLFVFFG